MEGALPIVVAGACQHAPVLAVPSSVGYGASFAGVAALLGMLNTCSPNVSLVNIDNRFVAASNASLINHMQAAVTWPQPNRPPCWLENTDKHPHPDCSARWREGTCLERMVAGLTAEIDLPKLTSSGIDVYYQSHLFYWSIRTNRVSTFCSVECKIPPGRRLNAEVIQISALMRLFWPELTRKNYSYVTGRNVY
jgi:hypothetical protein